MDPLNKTHPFLVNSKSQIYHESAEALETSFQSLEIVGTTCVEVKQGSPRPLKEALMAAKVLIRGGYQLGQGLGRHLEGMTKPLKLQENKGRCGLGYNMLNVGERSTAKLLYLQNRSSLMASWGLYQHFKSGGIMLSEQVAMVGAIQIKHKIKKEPPIQKDNIVLLHVDFGGSKNWIREECIEAETLVKMEKMMEQGD
ncbi:hypothetical protein CR513_56590, partial [Mucuna pruriens]